MDAEGSGRLCPCCGWRIGADGSSLMIEPRGPRRLCTRELRDVCCAKCSEEYEVRLEKQKMSKKETVIRHLAAQAYMEPSHKFREYYKDDHREARNEYRSRFKQTPRGNSPSPPRAPDNPRGTRPYSQQMEADYEQLKQKQEHAREKSQRDKQPQQAQPALGPGSFESHIRRPTKRPKSPSPTSGQPRRRDSIYSTDHSDTGTGTAVDIASRVSVSQFTDLTNPRSTSTITNPGQAPLGYDQNLIAHKRNQMPPPARSAYSVGSASQASFASSYPDSAAVGYHQPSLSYGNAPSLASDYQDSGTGSSQQPNAPSHTSHSFTGSESRSMASNISLPLDRRWVRLYDGGTVPYEVDAAELFPPGQGFSGGQYYQHAYAYDYLPHGVMRVKQGHIRR